MKESTMTFDQRRLLAGISTVQAHYFDEIWAWKVFYRAVAGIEIDILNILIPEKPAEEDTMRRLIILPEGMTPQRVYDLYAKHINCNRCDDAGMLDELISSERSARTSSYAAWIPDWVCQAEPMRTTTVDNGDRISFEERLIDELRRRFEKQKIDHWNGLSLCVGSRFADGSVVEISRGWASGTTFIRRHAILTSA